MFTVVTMQDQYFNNSRCKFCCLDLFFIVLIKKLNTVSKKRTKMHCFWGKIFNFFSILRSGYPSQTPITAESCWIHTSLSPNPLNSCVRVHTFLPIASENFFIWHFRPLQATLTINGLLQGRYKAAHTNKNGTYMTISAGNLLMHVEKNLQLYDKILLKTI